VGEREVEVEEGEVDEKEEDEENKRIVTGTTSGGIITLITNPQSTVDQPTILSHSRHVTHHTNPRVVSVPGHHAIHRTSQFNSPKIILPCTLIILTFQESTNKHQEFYIYSPLYMYVPLSHLIIFTVDARNNEVTTAG